MVGQAITEYLLLALRVIISSDFNIHGYDIQLPLKLSSFLYILSLQHIIAFVFRDRGPLALKIINLCVYIYGILFSAVMIIYSMINTDKIF